MQSRLLPVPPSATGTGAAVSLHRIYNRNLIFTGTSPSLYRRQISVTFSVSNNKQDHYAVLGLSADASPSDIKRSYRLLARKYHPDVNKDSQASEVFKRVHLAYEHKHGHAPQAPIMTLVDILHMNSGNDDSSYASNSLFQKIVIHKAAPFLKRSIKGMADQLDVIAKDCFMIADLGCSSGMNTLMVALNIIDTVHEVCQENNRETPHFQVCLNDLFENDFNNLFKRLPNFYKILKKDKGEKFGPCFVSAVPGSFYGRLFPSESLHFVHSSYSVHWLSQVPEGLENNKLNIYIAKSSPLSVVQAYRKQFHTDFTKFLQLRYEEIRHGGRMVLTLRTRSSLDPTSDDCSSFWELLTISLREMLNEGLVRESDINSFNLPFYYPHEDELKYIIQADGSFSLDDMNVFELNWDQHDYNNHGKNTTKLLRAITEPLFTSHFGKSLTDILFKKLRKNVAEHLATKKTRHLNIVVSLIKK